MFAFFKKLFGKADVNKDGQVDVQDAKIVATEVKAEVKKAAKEVKAAVKKATAKPKAPKAKKAKPAA